MSEFLALAPACRYRPTFAFERNRSVASRRITSTGTERTGSSQKETGATSYLPERLSSSNLPPTACVGFPGAGARFPAAVLLFWRQRLFSPGCLEGTGRGPRSSIVCVATVINDSRSAKPVVPDRGQAIGYSRFWARNPTVMQVTPVRKTVGPYCWHVDCY